MVNVIAFYNILLADRQSFKEISAIPMLAYEWQ
jgi:hypothetical protein